MKCRECGGDTRVLETRGARRRRECDDCGDRFTTKELNVHASEQRRVPERSETNRKLAAQGPWLLIGKWREWLHDATSNIDKENLAWRLGVSPRRVHEWMSYKSKQQCISLPLVEDCLWRYSNECHAYVEWTDIWDESEVLQTHPARASKKKGTKDDK